MAGRPRARTHCLHLPGPPLLKCSGTPVPPPAMAAYGALLLLLPFILILSWKFLTIAKGSKQQKPLNLPPGPRGLPIIGNLHQLDSEPHLSLLRLSKRYGPLMYLQLGRVPAVVVSSAELAEEIFKKNDLSVSSRPSTTASRYYTYNYSDMGFSPYGVSWRELRKVCVVNLLGAKRVEGYWRLREEEVGRMIASVSSRTSDLSMTKPVTINISKQLEALFSEILCRLAFGNRFGGGPAEGLVYSYENNIHDLFKEAEMLATGFFIADYIPWASWVDVLSGLRGKLKKNFAETDAFSEDVIRAHTKTTEEMPANEEEEEDLVDTLLRLQKAGNTHITRNSIKGIISNILVAGVNTTTAVGEYAMVELIRNPITMKRAQAEVRGVVGEKGKVEESDLRQLRYLKSVVKETLRLHPPAPLLVPRETMDSIDIGSYNIPAKTRVMINAWAIGRDLKTWENPDEFMPERFMDSTIDYKGCDFELIPFGSGRRICPGICFGTISLELALANLIYTFNWEHPTIGSERKESSNIDEKLSGLVLRPTSDLHLAPTKHKF